MCSRSEDLVKSIGEKNLSAKVYFLSEQSGLEPQDLWRLYGLTQGGTSALLLAEAQSPGLANNYLDALYYALTTRQESHSINRLAIIHKIIYQDDESRKPGTIHLMTNPAEQRSTWYQYFFENVYVRKIWNSLVSKASTSTSDPYQSWYREQPKSTQMQTFQSIFAQYTGEIGKAKRPIAKLKSIFNCIYALGYLVPFETGVLNPLSILFVQLMLDNKLNLKYILDSEVNLFVQPLKEVLTIINGYQHDYKASKDPLIHKLIAEADPEKILPAVINWSVTSPAPLHRQFFDLIISAHPHMINAPDFWGNSPLINACFHNNFQAVQDLLANPDTIPDKPGQDSHTAYFWAEQRGYIELTALFPPTASMPVSASPSFINNKLHFGKKWVEDTSTFFANELHFMENKPYTPMSLTKTWLALQITGANYPDREAKIKSCLERLQALRNPCDLVNLESESLSHSSSSSSESLDSSSDSIDDSSSESSWFDEERGYQREQSETIARYKEIAIRCPKRPDIIDKIFDHYDFMTKTKPEEYSREVNLQNYDPKLIVSYKKLISLIVFHSKPKLFFQQQDIAPELYPIYFNELFSTGDTDRIKAAINHGVLKTSTNWAALENYLMTASAPHQLLLINCLGNHLQHHEKTKKHLYPVIFRHQSLFLEFRNFIFNSSYDLESRIAPMLSMPREQLKLLVDSVLNAQNEDHKNKLFTALIRHHTPIIEQYLSDTRVYDAFKVFLNKKPGYLELLCYRIKNPLFLSDFLQSSLGSIGLLGEQGQLSNEGQRQLLSVLSWDKSEFNNWSTLFAFFFETEEKTRALLLFFLCDEALKKAKSNEPLLDFLCKKLDLFSKLVVAEPERKLLPSFLNLLFTIAHKSPWHFPTLLLSYTETRAQIGSSSSVLLNPRKEFFEALLEQPSGVNFSSYLTPEEIENEILIPLIRDQEEVVQQIRLTNLLAQFKTLQEKGKIEFMKKVIDHPVVYDLLLLKYDGLLEHLIAILSQHGYQNHQMPDKELLSCLDRLCHYVYSDNCKISNKAKLLFFFKVNYESVRRHYPLIRELVKADAELYHSFMEELFHNLPRFEDLLYRPSTNRLAFFLDFLKWISLNQSDCFQIKSTWYYQSAGFQEFPEDKVNYLFGLLPDKARAILPEKINEIDDPAFKEWIESSDALAEYLVSLEAEGVSCGPGF